MQNLHPIQYFETAPKEGIVDCLRTGVPHNITIMCVDVNNIEQPFLFACPGLYGQRYAFTCPYYTLTPFCTSWDGAAFTRDDSCEVVSSDAATTTCRCSNSDQQQRLRRLASADSDLKELSSVAQIVTTSFVQIIALVGDKAAPAVEYDHVVLILASAFVGLAVLFLVLYARHDNQHIVQFFKKPVDGKVAKVVVAHHTGHSSPALALNYSFPLHEDTSRLYLTEADDSGALKRMRHISISEFFNAVLPKELTGLPWHRRLSEKFFVEHDWASLFQKQTHLPHGHQPAVHMAMFRKTDSWAHVADTHHELKSLRWLLIAGRLLNFLFFTTLLVTAFYSDDGTCEAQVLEGDCLSQSGIFGLSQTCTWEPTLDSACQFNQLSFDNPLTLLLVAVVVTVLALPFDHLFYFAVVKLKLSTTDVAAAHLKAVTAKTQRQVEPLKLKNGASDAAAVQPQVPRKKGRTGKASKKPSNPVRVHPRPAPAAATHVSHGGHSDQEALPVKNFSRGALAGTHYYAKHLELSGVLHRRDKFLRAARLLLIQTKTDRLSARKEVHTLLNDIHTGEIRLRVEPAKMLTLYLMFRRIARVMASSADAGVRFVLRRGNAPPSEFRDKIDEDTIQYVTDEVTYGRTHSKAVKRIVGALSSDIDKEAYLIQQFLVECLPPLQRRLASLYLFRKVELSKVGLSNTSLYALFAVLMLYLAFTVVYIFMAGTSIGSRASMQWLLVVGICFAYDLLLLQPIKIWTKYVAVSSIASGDLRLYHAMLRERSRFVLTRINGVVRGYNQMLHHTNPACRAARTFPELAAARLLISLNDSDLPVSMWRDQRLTISSVFGMLAQAVLTLLLSPLLVMPAVTHEFVVDTMSTVLLNGALIGLVLLSFINFVIPVGIALLLVLGVLVMFLSVWHAEASLERRVAAVVPVGHDAMLEDELDQPIDAATAQAPHALTVVHDYLQTVEAEEFTLLKDSGRGVSMHNHLKDKSDLYEKLIRKYKLRHERASLAAPEEEDEAVPLFDCAPGEIATPYKVKPFEPFSPGASQNLSRVLPESPAAAAAADQEETKDAYPEDRDAPLLLKPVAAVPPASPSKADRFVPRHIRREQELQRRKSEEEQQLAAAEKEEFQFEFSNPMSPGPPGQQLPGMQGTKAGAVAEPPAADIAALAELLKKQSLEDPTTLRRPVERPPKHMIRVPKEVKRARDAEQQRQKQHAEEEQKLREESFGFDFGIGEEDDKEGVGESKVSHSTTAPTAAPAPTTAPAAGRTTMNLRKNLRSMRKDRQKQRQEEARRAEAQHMEAPEHDFDIQDLLFGDHQQTDEAKATAVVPTVPSTESIYRSSSPVRSAIQRPSSSYAPNHRAVQTGATVLSRTRPGTAHDSASRAAALDAAHRAENISRLNRIVAMNNFVQRVATPPTNPTTAAISTQPARLQSPPRSQAPQPSNRRRAADRLREEQEHKRAAEERADWEMLNDDLFQSDSSSGGGSDSDGNGEA